MTKDQLDKGREIDWKIKMFSMIQNHEEMFGSLPMEDIKEHFPRTLQAFEDEKNQLIENLNKQFSEL